MFPSPQLSNRRDVLSAAGRGLLAAGVLGSTSWLSRAQETRPNEAGAPTKKIGWAVVGLGKLALEEVIPAFPKSKWCQLTALVSGSPDKAAQLALKQGIDAQRIYDYERYDQLANDPSVDAVYITLPNS